MPTTIKLYVQQSDNCVLLLRFIYSYIKQFRQNGIRFTFIQSTKENLNAFLKANITKLPHAIINQNGNISTITGAGNIQNTLQQFTQQIQMPKLAPRTINDIPASGDEYLTKNLFTGVKRGKNGFEVEDEEDKFGEEGDLNKMDINKKMAQFTYGTSSGPFRSNQNELDDDNGNIGGIGGNGDNGTADNIEDHMQDRMQEITQKRQGQLNIQQFEQTRHKNMPSQQVEKSTNNLIRKTEDDFYHNLSEETHKGENLSALMGVNTQHTGPKNDMDLILSMLEGDEYSS